MPVWAGALAWVLALAVLAVAAPGLPLERYRDDPGARRVLLAATVALMALRWFNTAALQGVVLHFLGATIAVLMFGGRLACWMMALASLAGVHLGAAGRAGRWTSWSPARCRWPWRWRPDSPRCAGFRPTSSPT